MKHSVRLFAVVALLSVFVLGWAPAGVASPTVTRPIEDFLSQQGTYCPDPCYLFVPPDPNFLGWATNLAKEPVLFAGVDYAGLASEAYAAGQAPEMSGTVTERPLPDGTAEVTVLLHTKGANAWVIQLDMSGDVLDQIANKATLFGHRPRDVAAGAGQALADSLLQVTFINSAPGAPLPDLLQINGTSAEKFIGFDMQAYGPLTAQFGVAEGTPGRATITQKGLYVPPGASIGHRFDYNFPVENIRLRVVGH